MTTTGSIDLASLREMVRERLTMVQVATFDGLALRKDGAIWKGCCPFHMEKHGSFVAGGRWPDRYHCFGCGEKGDMFDYWSKRHDLDHKEAVMALAGLAGVHVGEMTFERPKGGTAPRRPENAPVDGEAAPQKPSLPPLYKLSREAVRMVAETRMLDPEAVWIAARVAKRMVYCQWPQSEHHGRWYLRSSGAWPSWAAVDSTLNVAEFRRLDNGLYDRQDGSKIKSWSTAGKAWPLGALDVPQFKRVLLVEGGPDMLAGYHFLRRWRMLEKVTVVCMLGASNKIRKDALPLFKGARVRIMVDADTLKDDPMKSRRKLVGLEAAWRWQNQLTEAGAAVTTFNVGDLYDLEDLRAWHEGTIQAEAVKIVSPGYVTKDGAKVKDLNDLAKCDDEVLGSDDVRRAIKDWDF